jgi:hypothetical protein
VDEERLLVLRVVELLGILERGDPPVEAEPPTAGG